LESPGVDVAELLVGVAAEIIDLLVEVLEVILSIDERRDLVVLRFRRVR